MEQEARRRLGPLYPRLKSIRDQFVDLGGKVEKIAEEAEQAARDLQGFEWYRVALPDPQHAAYEVGQTQYFLGEARRALQRALDAYVAYHATYVRIK